MINYNQKYLIVLILGCIAMFLHFIQCNSQHHNQNSMDAAQEKSLIAEGFVPMKVERNTASACPVQLISEKDPSLQLDPINWEEYGKDISSGIYWVKYRPLRRASRCKNLLPVQINEIYKP